MPHHFSSRYCLRCIDTISLFLKIGHNTILPSLFKMPLVGCLCGCAKMGRACFRLLLRELTSICVRSLDNTYYGITGNHYCRQTSQDVITTMPPAILMATSCRRAAIRHTGFYFTVNADDSRRKPSVIRTIDLFRPDGPRAASTQCFQLSF